MKDFIKQTMAVVVGMVLVSIIMGVLTIVSMAGMIASEGMSAPIEKKSVLRICLQGTMTERAQEPNPLMQLGGSMTQQIALDEALTALDKAAKNDKIEGIYLEGGVLAAYPAQAQELRQALLRFKKSGKWIVAYADTYSRMSYYLCSVAVPQPHRYDGMERIVEQPHVLHRTDEEGRRKDAGVQGGHLQERR